MSGKTDVETGSGVIPTKCNRPFGPRQFRYACQSSEAVAVTRRKSSEPCSLAKVEGSRELTA